MHILADIHPLNELRIIEKIDIRDAQKHTDPSLKITEGKPEQYFNADFSYCFHRETKFQNHLCIKIEGNEKFNGLHIRRSKNSE